MLTSFAPRWTELGLLELCASCSFVLAIAGAVRRPSLAAAIVLSDEESPRIIIRYFDLERKIELTLVDLVSMRSVSLCIDDDGDVVAFAQANDLYICRIGHVVERIVCSGPIEQLGFHRGTTLVVKHSSQIFVWSPSQSDLLLVEREVREVAIGRHIVVMRHSGEVGLVHFEEGSFERFQPIPNLHVPVGSRVFMRQQKHGVLMSAEGNLDQNERRPFVLFDVGFDGTQPKRLFEGMLSDFIGKETTCRVLPSEERSVFAVAEQDCYSKLWMLRNGESPVAISPPNVEVMYADAAAEQRAIVFVGSDISNPLLSTSRQLMVADGADEWRTQSIAGGAFLLPKWFNGRWLAYGYNNGEGCYWKLMVRMPPFLPSPAPTQRARASQAVLRADSSGVHYTLVQANQIPRPRSVILYIPGPHRQITEGAQDSFFHQWLWSSAQKLVNGSTQCLALNPPGSVGLGASARRTSKALIDESSDAILSVLDRLWSTSVKQIGIVCGSLGALPVLACLERIKQPCACCLVAPVFDATAALSDPWPSIVAGKRAQSLSHARAIPGTSLLVIQGEHDEFAPAKESADFILSQDPLVKTELTLLPGEGHIFRNPSSWARVSRDCLVFFREFLDGK